LAKAYFGFESLWGFSLPSSKFDEDYFYGVRSGYKTGYTWRTAGPLLLSQFKEVMLHSQYKSGHWLDAGCAKGFLLKIASRHGWKPHGFDVSAYAVGEARKNCPDGPKTFLERHIGYLSQTVYSLSRLRMFHLYLIPEL
jgi:2-polyprenyl-3-methyl-5-hydroxy-6-metoxy-1,4-benzoquinol methylase